MGRRELFIALAFAAVGVVTYQLTMPATSPSSSRFSVGQILAEFRREVRGEPGRASVTHRGVLAAPADITELRLSAVGTLTLVGEPRGDVVYELTVQAVGADDVAAQAAAQNATLSSDRVGHVLALTHPRQPRSTSTLAVRVPARLAIRLEGIRRATVSGVAVVHLEALVGDVQLAEVTGSVSGSHRNGALAVSGAGAVDLTLTGSRASFSRIHGAIDLSGRGGEVRIDDTAGAVGITVTDVDVHITRPRGRVRLAGSNGQVVVDRPTAATDIEGRRLDVTITLAAAVPVTAVTTERSLRLLIDGAPAITIDAATTGAATIDASVFDRTPEVIAGGQRLHHRFGDAATVALRNQRGAIVIGRSK